VLRKFNLIFKEIALKLDILNQAGQLKAKRRPVTNLENATPTRLQQRIIFRIETPDTCGLFEKKKVIAICSLAEANLSKWCLEVSTCQRAKRQYEILI